jgi:hypothetical protein
MNYEPNMRHLLPLFLFFCSPLLANAQCDVVTIPGSATVIDTDGPHSVFGAQWVCSGSTVTLSSGFINAFIETNADVTVETNLGVFSVRANSSLTVSGFNNNVYYDPTATVIDNGTNTLLTECPGLAFDYSEAPDEGCDLTAGIPSPREPIIGVYPNPAHDLITVVVQGEQLLDVTLMDLYGRSIWTRTAANGQLDLDDVGPGQYMAALRLATGVVHRPILVQ